MAKIIKNSKCPNCGGTIEMLDEFHGRCEYCKDIFEIEGRKAKEKEDIDEELDKRRTGWKKAFVVLITVFIISMICSIYSIAAMCLFIGFPGAIITWPRKSDVISERKKYNSYDETNKNN